MDTKQEIIKCHNETTIFGDEIDSNDVNLIFIHFNNYYYCYTIEEMQRFCFYVPYKFERKIENGFEIIQDHNSPFVIQENNIQNARIKQFDIKNWIYKFPYMEIFIQGDMFGLLDEGYNIFDVNNETKDVILFKSMVLVLYMIIQLNYIQYKE